MEKSLSVACLCMLGASHIITPEVFVNDVKKLRKPSDF